MWRIVFFDMPEEQKTKRDAFAGRLRRMGFAVLQRKYATYIEAAHIDNEAPLREYFHI